LWAYSYAFYSLSSTTAQARTLQADYDRCRSAGGEGLSLPCRRGWGSFHSGGLNFLLCDGAVRFLDQAVDVHLFADLGTIAGGEPAKVPP
jgi:prepilin-type processing-associated H-X9-DG protein